MKIFSTKSTGLTIYICVKALAKELLQSSGLECEMILIMILDSPRVVIESKVHRRKSRLLKGKEMRFAVYFPISEELLEFKTFL